MYYYVKGLPFLNQIIVFIINVHCNCFQSMQALDYPFEELDVANMYNMVFVFSKKRVILFII